MIMTPDLQMEEFRWHLEESASAPPRTRFACVIQELQLIHMIIVPAAWLWSVRCA
jgi:hypothetical protein